MAISIQIERLNKILGTRRILDGITLEIQPGELFFFLGPSGCGKTTLLRCVAGLVRPDSGGISFDDQNILELLPEQRQAVMVFQSYALWPHLTVAKNVAFGLKLQQVATGEIKRRVADALALVKMADRASAYPNELSGGQQQRVALARALAVRPRCLLLDEPLSNLDAQLRLEMRGEIRRICKEVTLTTLYVTHDQKEALSMADRMAILAEGKIQQCGTPREIYRQPASRWVAQFIGATNLVEGIVSGLNGGMVRIQTKAGEISASTTAPENIHLGQVVTLSVRPEAVHLGVSPAGTPNTFAGVIRDSVYQGEDAQHHVELLPSGEFLKINELNPAVVFSKKSGERVPLWFAPEDVVILAQQKLP